MDGTVLGTLGAPPVALIDDLGVVELAGSGRTLRWWVVAEDRVHLTEREVATRRHRIDHAPVIETAMKVPGGDVVGRTFAFVGSGTGGSLAFELTNLTAVPVAIAVVVGPGEASRSGADLIIDGATPFRTSRRSARAVVADSLEELEGLVGRDGDGATVGKWGALLVPLPHSQAVTVVVGGADPATVPGAEQVAAGWSRQVARGTRLELGDDPRAEHWETDRRDFLLVDADAGTSVAALARRLAASIRLGWTEEASTATEQLLDHQRARGFFDADDRAAATIEAVDALGAWARTGLPGDAFAGLVEPVGRAAAWLTRRGGRSLAPADRERASAAIAGAAPLMVLAGQPDAANAMGAPQGAAPAAPSPVEVAPQPAAPAAARTRRGLLAGPSPSTDDAAGRLVELVDSIAQEGSAGLTLLAGTDLVAARRTIEVFDLPTRWGRLSYAVRWHGERPALLWEIEPWEVESFAEPTLSVPGLDRGWTARGLRGETLVGR